MKIYDRLTDKIFSYAGTYNCLVLTNYHIKILEMLKQVQHDRKKCKVERCSYTIRYYSEFNHGSTMPSSRYPEIASWPIVLHCCHPKLVSGSIILDYRHPEIASGPIVLHCCHPELVSGSIILDYRHPEIASWPIVLHCCHPELVSGSIIQSYSIISRTLLFWQELYLYKTIYIEVR